jgi:phosphoribosyl 1,2-cyclic phosphodiesterase
VFRFRVLGSGSTGNATLVEAGGARLLIDAGLGPKVLAERLLSAGVAPESLDAVLLSHEHNDHARGAAAFSRKWGVPLWGTRGTYAAAGLGAETLPPYERLEPLEPRSIAGATVLAVPVPHDAAGPVAFVVSGQGRRLGHATDLGHLSRALSDAFRSCDALLVESNYEPFLLRDGPYPWSLKERILGPRGHLANGDVARFLARELGEVCRTVVLAHLSQQNNHPELALKAASEALALRGRSEVSLVVTAASGTQWVGVGPDPAPVNGPRQLQLF